MPHIGKFLHDFGLRKVLDWDVWSADIPKVATLPEANLITSENAYGGHFPVLDIDLPCLLLQSSNYNTHLLIKKSITKEQLDKLLSVMVEVGIMQQGNLNAFRLRGFVGVRVPWEAKNVGDRESSDCDEAKQVPEPTVEGQPT